MSDQFSGSAGPGSAGLRPALGPQASRLGYAEIPAGGVGAISRQVGGDHYQGRVMQPWDIIDAWGLDFWEGNALKYLLRRKPGVPRSEDLRKAIHYLEHAAERAEASECIAPPSR